MCRKRNKGGQAAFHWEAPVGGGTWSPELAGARPSAQTSERPGGTPGGARDPPAPGALPLRSLGLGLPGKPGGIRSQCLGSSRSVTAKTRPKSFGISNPFPGYPQHTHP